MMTIKDLITKWNSINPHTGGFFQVSGNHPLSFHFGYSGNARKCFIVLDTGKIKPPLSSKAIHTECVPLTKSEFGLYFTLCYESLDELFVKLCWDLVDSSRESSNPVDKIVEQYTSWSKLFQQMNLDYLSSSRQKGLIGELLYLLKAINYYGEKNAIIAWVGPEGNDQDFIFQDKWVEVKAVSIAADVVAISSIQQLERDDHGELAVYFMDKTTSFGASTFSLPEIIDKITQKLTSQSIIDKFICKLAKYGYFEKDSDYYSNNRYRFAEVRLYSVNADFPKLTRKNLPLAVTAAEYSLSLAMINLCRIEG